jgi:hypothetical protein
MMVSHDQFDAPEFGEVCATASVQSGHPADLGPDARLREVAAHGPKSGSSGASPLGLEGRSDAAGVGCGRVGRHRGSAFGSESHTGRSDAGGHRVDVRRCRPRWIQVLLELDPGVEPIAGARLQPSDGDPDPFTGWLQLTQMLEAIRRSATGS